MKWFPQKKKATLRAAFSVSSWSLVSEPTHSDLEVVTKTEVNFPDRGVEDYILLCWAIVK